MWLFTDNGYYSIVQDRYDHDYVLVRARRKDDLERLPKRRRERRKIIETPTADYPFRIRVKKSRFADLAAHLVTRIDYGNFKSAVAQQDRERANTYHDVWAVLHDLETDDRKRFYYHEAMSADQEAGFNFSELDGWYDEDFDDAHPEDDQVPDWPGRDQPPLSGIGT